MFRKAILSVLGVAVLGTATVKPAEAQTLGFQIGNTPIQVTLGNPGWPATYPNNYNYNYGYAPVYTQPAPVYTQPVYTNPAPVYTQPVYVHPRRPVIHDIRRNHYHR